RRGATVAMLVSDRDGVAIDGQCVEALANGAGISVRSGCFCNPGAGEAALGLDPAVLAPWFGRSAPVSFDELRAAMWREHGRVLAAVRVSFGIASNFTDAHRFVELLRTLIDRRGCEVGR